MTETLGCKVPDSLYDRFDQAADDRDVSISDVVRQALHIYTEENPDNLEALQGVQWDARVNLGEPREERVQELVENLTERELELLLLTVGGHSDD
jgi:Arc/MetJ-type ribon-helix-helix transcriptional regulator